MKIKNLRKSGDTIFWTIEKEDQLSEKTIIRNYRTNEAGEGLFIDGDFWYTKQLAGTAQFQLHQKTMPGVRKAIQRYFSEK